MRSFAVTLSECNIEFCSMRTLKLIFFSILITGLFGHDEYTDQDPPLALYITFTENASHVATIHWHNYIASEKRVFEYRVKGSNNWKFKDVISVHFPHTERYIHTSNLRNLPQGSIIEFRIPGKREIHTFRTMPDHLRNPVSFVVGGDFMHHEGLFKRTAEKAAKSNPYFVAMGGDLAYADANPEKVHRWFNFFEIWTDVMLTQDGHIIPIIPGIGNHEVKGGYSTSHHDAAFFFKLFQLRNNRAYYSVDAGDYLRMLMLDTDHTNTIEGLQSFWLEETLKNSQDRSHIFPVYHVPAYPSFRNPSDIRNTKIRAFWVPLFEKYNVNIAFENHDHTYKRTIPLRNNESHPDGITYIGDGAWGVSLRKPVDHWYLETAHSANHYLKVDISNTGTVVTAIETNGNILDNFEHYTLLSNSDISHNLPVEIILHQNYPNPFNPTTTIPISLSERKNLRLTIFNMNGSLVKQIYNGEKEAGIHHFTFNAVNLSSGTYLVQLQTPESSQVIQMLFIK